MDINDPVWEPADKVFRKYAHELCQDDIVGLILIKNVYNIFFKLFFCLLNMADMIKRHAKLFSKWFKLVVVPDNAAYFRIQGIKKVSDQCIAQAVIFFGD